MDAFLVIAHVADGLVRAAAAAEAAAKMAAAAAVRVVFNVRRADVRLRQPSNLSVVNSP